jgi:hypothetical protein
MKNDNKKYVKKVEYPNGFVYEPIKETEQSRLLFEMLWERAETMRVERLEHEREVMEKYKDDDAEWIRKHFGHGYTNS